MNNIVYLKNGQKAKLIKKLTDDKYLVAPMFRFNAYDGEIYEEQGEEKVVSQIFINSPEQIYDTKILIAKNILQEIKRKNKELNREKILISSQIEALKKTKTNLTELIINKNELLTAERLTVISKYEPIDLKKVSGWNKDQYGFTITFVFNITKKGISIGVQKLYEYDSNYSIQINQEIGILVNKTDEEITEIIKNLVLKSKISDHDLSRVEDKYLNEELLKRKRLLRKKRTAAKIEDLKKEIELKQKQLKLLENEE